MWLERMATHLWVFLPRRALILLLLSAELTIYAGRVDSQIVINEVMSNAPGLETGSGSPGDRMEFIELLNLSTSQAVDLKGWTIEDDDASDDLTEWDRNPGDSTGSSTVVSGTTILKAGGFALILDPEYFEGGEGGWYDIAESTLVITVGNTTLGNGLSGNDPLVLRNSEGDTVSTFGTPGWDDDFPQDPGDGISWERFDPSMGDEAANWIRSEDPAGCTPGRRNSRSIRINVSIPGSTLVVDPARPEAGGSLDLTGTVINRGLAATPPFEVRFFLDSNQDGRMGPGEAQRTEGINGAIEPGEHLSISARLDLGPSGYYTIGMTAVLAEDGDTTDNTAGVEIMVGDASRRVVVNEVYYNPGDGEEEWVEVYNRSSRTVDMSNWRLSDNRTTGLLPGHPLLLGEGEYAVLAGDSASLVTSRSYLSGRHIFEVDPFPSLGNRGDTLSLETASGYLSDRVEYSSGWGGRKGVSLERVNPDELEPGPSGWGSSVDPVGSTPAERNSIFQGAVVSGASLQVSPSVFSPDGDGRDDRAVIRYQLPVPRARVRMLVFDVTGRRRRILLDQVESGSEGLVVWDGRDDGGRTLPIGIYVVFMEAIEGYSGYQLREKTGVVLGGIL